MRSTGKHSRHSERNMWTCRVGGGVDFIQKGTETQQAPVKRDGTDLGG